MEPFTPPMPSESEWSRLHNLYRAFDLRPQPEELELSPFTLLRSGAGGLPGSIHEPNLFPTPSDRPDQEYFLYEAGSKLSSISFDQTRRNSLHYVLSQHAVPIWSHCPELEDPHHTHHFLTMRVLCQVAVVVGQVLKRRSHQYSTS